MWLRAVTRRLGDRGSPSIDHLNTREHDMNRYAITEKAGRFVAGETNIGVGTVLTLTDKQAEHELRLGTLRPLDVAAQPGPSADETPPKPAPKASKSKKPSRIEPDLGEDHATADDAG
jgi:hypothetical protein